jgi:hypothetical protein
METPIATHFSSGSVVMPIDELTAEDLRLLLDLKLSEPDRIRAREEEELERRLWWLLSDIPKPKAAEIAKSLGVYHVGVVLREWFDDFYAAATGRRVNHTESLGYYEGAAASVAA